MSADRPRGASDLLRRAAAADPHRDAVVDAAVRLSWAELDHAVTAGAAALLGRGLAEGARVALQLPTGADLVVAYLAVQRAGLVAVPINPAYTAAETAHIVEDSGAALHLDATSARELLAAAPADATDPDADRRGEALAALMYTSGTSGRVKGAMLSARALLANLEQLAAVEPALITSADVLFCPLPLTHIFGLNAGLGMALNVGATLVLADRFDPGATLDAMAAERVTTVLGVPGQYAAWLAHPRRDAGFASVRFAMSGSATLARGVVEGFASTGLTVHDGYGLTEAAPVVCINAIDGDDSPAIGSIGRALPGIELELRDASGDEVEDGDPGRIIIRGANLFSGYWPDGAGGPDADGWFGTGDIAVADERGNLRLVGRSTDLVIVNGFNVYPAEVEAVFAAVEGVAEVAVVGVADAATGEAVHAYVVPAPAASLQADDLLAAASRSLARFKLPTSIKVVDALPRTVTGKIMKWQLEGRSHPEGGGRGAAQP